MKRALLFCLTIVTAALIGGAALHMAAGAAQASGVSTKTKYSEAEKVGFAFYRLANRVPPFESWITNKDKYLLAKPSARREYLNNELTRLNKAYNEYMIDDHLIILRTQVKVKIPNKAERGVYDEMGLRKPVQIVLTEITDNFFPVQVGQMWVALVPDKLEEYLQLSLNAEEFGTLTRKLGIQVSGTNQAATLELRIRPKTIDASAPLQIDTIEAWLMLGDIATAALWTNANPEALVWEKNAEWYLPYQQKELLDLYGR